MEVENGNQDFDYDLVTIGAGSGGVRAARMASGTYGAKVAVVELPFGYVSGDGIGGAGGTCVIRGCVPKKLLVYASEFSENFSDAVGFGWAASAPPHDIRALIARKATEIDRLNGVYRNILKNSGVHYYEGRGIVLDPHTIEVRGTDGTVKTLRAKNILIATGGHAVKINIPGAEHAITSDHALVIDSLAAKQPLVIVGGGYIGVEFAGIFKGLGADVHLVCRQKYPLGVFDGECRAVVADNMERRGIHLHMECSPSSITRNPDGSLLVHYADKHGATGEIHAAKVMFATGRAPSTKGLGLEDAGVRTDPNTGAITVDEYSRTNVPSIWAIGDVTGRMALTPVALMEGKALAATMFGGVPTKPNYDNIPTAVFAQPPLSSVGYSEEQAIKQLSGDIDVYVSRFRPMRNTLSGRDEKTFMKMLVHVDTDRVVGCHMVGPDAAEIMQGLGIALKCGATKAVFDSTVGIHPSAAEEWVTMSSPARTVKGEGEKVPGK
ncbi:hypothetical protein Ndes2437B_g06962 [Nannochloris sp. 'desiccata']